MKRLPLIIIAILAVVCFNLVADNQKLITEKQSQSVVLGEKINALTINNHKLVLGNKKIFSRNHSLVDRNRSLTDLYKYLIIETKSLNEQLESKNQFENCFAATCRISIKNNRGTGCCYKESKDSIFIITNAHVVSDYKTVYCEFWRNGHLVKPVKGTIVIKDKSKDVAVISINKTDLSKDFVVASVPLAPPDYMLKKKQTITSVGCVLANWPSLFKGHFIKYDGSDILFLPKPEGGRSGSAIFDAKGKMIVGLLWGVSNTGHAKSLQIIHSVLDNQDCPNGKCPSK